MTPRPKTLIGLSFAAVLAAATPFHAQAAPPMRGASPATRPLNLSSDGSVAVQAAQAAQAAAVAPGALPADTPAETVTSTPVQGVTVRTQPRGTIVASTDARPLAAPNFNPADALDKPLAIGLGGGTAIGRHGVPNEPPPAGLLATNPELIGDASRGEVAITSVF